MAPTRVLIVGGGFAGRYCASRLAWLLPRTAEITLVDRVDYMLYTPMLTEVAGSVVAAGNVMARGLPARVRFVQGKVSGADLKAKTVTLSDGQVLKADQLVFALGSTTNFRDVEGARENSVTMKTLDDAERVRTTAEKHVALAAAETDPARRKQLLTFVVAGGGYTGVETIAALNTLVRERAKELGIDQADVTMTIVEPGKRLMDEMPERLASYGREQLERSGMRVLLGTQVEKVNGSQSQLANGETLDAGMLIWDTGIVPQTVLKTIEGPKGKRGGFAVDSTFLVRGMHGVWALGDCAEIPKPDGSGKFFEPTAQNAIREGTLLAHNIYAALRGRPLRPFRYKQIGELALVSSSTGVAHVFGLQVTGLLAWAMWRVVYLAKMPGIKQRLGILADWLRKAFAPRSVSPKPAASRPKRFNAPQDAGKVIDLTAATR